MVSLDKLDPSCKREQVFHYQTFLQEVYSSERAKSKCSSPVNGGVSSVMAQLFVWIALSKSLFLFSLPRCARLCRTERMRAVLLTARTVYKRRKLQIVHLVLYLLP